MVVMLVMDGDGVNGGNMGDEGDQTEDNGNGSDQVIEARC